MNLKRIKTTFAAGVLAASMIMPSMTAFAAVDTSKVIDGTSSTNNIITKTVETPDGVSYTDESFTYTFVQDGYQDGSFIGNTTDNGIVANKVEAKISDVTISDMSSTNASAKTGATDIKTLSAKGSVDLSNLTQFGVYTYTVTESARTASDKNGTTWEYATNTYRLRVYVKNAKQADGSYKTVKEMTIIDTTNDTNPATAGTDRDSSKVASAEFVNKMTKRGGSNDGDKDKDTPTPGTDTPALVISKTVSDKTFEAADQQYTFRVYFTDNDLSVKKGDTTLANTYSYYKVTANGTRDENPTAIKSGDTIKLKNGESAEFYSLYAGTRVTVKEIDDVANMAGAKATVTSNGTQAKQETLNKTYDNTTNENSYNVSNVLIGEGANVVAYENTYTDITVTGVVTDIAPYITLVVVAVAAIAAYVGFKKRIAR